MFERATTWGKCLKGALDVTTFSLNTGDTVEVSNLTTQIVSVRVQNDGIFSKKYVEYQIQITSPEGQHNVWRRYAKFLELQERLQGLYDVPALAEKVVFGSKSEEVVEERKRSFEAFLSFICSNPALSSHPLVVEFLFDKSVAEQSLGKLDSPLPTQEMDRKVPPLRKSVTQTQYESFFGGKAADPHFYGPAVNYVPFSTPSAFAIVYDKSEGATTQMPLAEELEPPAPVPSNKPVMLWIRIIKAVQLTKSGLFTPSPYCAWRIIDSDDKIRKSSRQRTKV